MKNIRYLFVIAILSGLAFYSCEEQISDLGQNFLNPGDTLGTLMLDSKTDSLTISVNDFKQYINTFNSNYMMVGFYQDWESRSLLRFTNVSGDYDSGTVVSARIKMTYGDYFFRDSLGSVAFDVLKLNRRLSFNTITNDSVNASDIDNVVQGSFSGSPVDSAQISITLNNQLAQDWLEYAADTNYSVKNNGVILIPTGGSTIKGFFSSLPENASIRPTLEIIVTKNSQTDTLNFDQSETVALSDAPSSVILPDRIYLQSGIAFRSIINFGLSKLPDNVIINDALLTLTLDTANSFLSPVSDQRLVAAMITDSVKKTDSLGFITLNRVGNEYSIRFIQIMQNWNAGLQPNLGLALRNVSEPSTMDIFTFFGSTYSDQTKVPHLRIRYTLRNNQKQAGDEEMKIKLFIILAIIGITCGNAFSQGGNNEEFNGGSPYTIFGIGDLKLNTAVRTESMSVLGIGLQGDYINTLNPASNTKLQYTKFSLTGNYGYLETSNGTQTSKFNNGNITGINIGIPIDKEEGWVLNFGLNPMSEVNYKILSTGDLGGESYTNTYSGEGGLTRINVAMAYRFLKSLSIGAEYNYAFGNIVSQSTTEFVNPALVGNFFRTETDLSKSFFKGGMVFALENLVNPKSKNLKYLTVGFFYQMPIDLTANEESIVTSSTGTDSNVVRSGTINIPAAYGFGLANRFGDRVNVAVDAYFQQWSDYSDFGVTPSNFTNSSRFGAGFELLPSPDRDRSFFEKLTYRAGGFYEKAYYLVNSEEINTLGFSLGVGIPISDFNSIDLSFNYSMRGKEENGLIKDRLFMIHAGVNFGELWFLRPDEDF